jgi:3'-phosphoadenosine 5'-phosphosulfate (PAPS) 3'-phosphatase
VQDFVSHLAENGILDSDVIHISGAGAKSLRLVLPTQNEALWFFPKEGTSRWDIAASDALLRQLGGTVSDKNGKELDYCKSREDSDNNEGIIASNDAALHVECMRLFQEGKWIERYAA